MSTLDFVSLMLEVARWMGIESMSMIRYVTGDVIAACIVPKIGYTMLASWACAFVVVVVAVFRKKWPTFH